jgi:hypothetical protein
MKLHTHTHTHRRSRNHTYVLTYIHTYIYTHIRIPTHIHTHTYIHTYIHTYTQTQSDSRYSYRRLSPTLLTRQRMALSRAYMRYTNRSASSSNACTCVRDQELYIQGMYSACTHMYVCTSNAQALQLFNGTYQAFYASFLYFVDSSLSLSLYICIYVCMYVCMYACMYACMYVCISSPAV